MQVVIKTGFTLCQVNWFEVLILNHEKERLCMLGVDVASVYGFSIRFPSCSDSVIPFIFHFTAAVYCVNPYSSI